MSAFTQYRTTTRLKALAANPFDLTKEGNLTPERIEKMSSEACGFKLLYGMQRVTDEVVSTLFDLAKEAKVMEKMEAMQSGEIINRIEGFPSEDRAVLHTAMRDFFDRPHKAESAFKAAQAAKRECDKLKVFMEKIDQENKYTDLIVIGIGGSELGPKTIYFALQAFCKPGRRVHFVSNVDPDDVAAVVRHLDLKKTLAVVISKSGGTLETLTNEELTRAYFRKAGLNSDHHFIAVTGEGSPLDNPKKYLASFYIWDFVGGRYSSTSMVGAVLLAFACGMDVYREFLKGANAMDKVALERDPHKNLPLLFALLGIWNRNFLNCSTLAIIPYSQGLARFAAHIQQCDMESNGKHIDKQGKRVDFHTGPVIWGEPGNNSQHSFFQLIHQGTDIIPLEFIGFRESQYHEDLEVQGTLSQEKLLANLFAQSLALAMGKKDVNPNKMFEGNRPSSIIMSKSLNPFSMGALLSLYEHKVAFQGFVWGINSFDQEGVQLGKVLANKIVDLFAAKRNPQKKIEAYPLGQALIKQIGSLF